jgi:Phage integrase, N-terminal SAM-like domain
MSAQGRVYSFCGCRAGTTGRRLGCRCPRRGEPGHGSWYVSAELPAGPDRTRRLRRGGFPDETAARSALERLVMPSPGDAADRLMTTGRWLTRWLENRTSIRYSTRRSYESHVRRYLDPYLGQILLADLKTAHFHAMFTATARQSAAAGQPVTAATLVRIRATLRAALNAAVRAGYLTLNPACGAELPPARRPRPVLWTADRIREWQATGSRPQVAVWLPAHTAAFLNAISHDRMYAAYHLIRVAGTAPRRGCRTALVRRRPRQRDRGDQPATAAARRSAGPRAAEDPAKRAGHRTGPHHRRDPAPAPGSAGCRKKGSRKRLPRQRLRVHRDQRRPDGTRPPDPPLRQLSDEAGLPPVRLHELRHGAASLALAAGAELKTIQDPLGHCSIVLIADTYISVLPDVARQAAEDTAALILRADYLVPGTARPRRRQGLPRPGRSARTVSSTAPASLTLDGRSAIGPGQGTSAARARRPGDTAA